MKTVEHFMLGIDGQQKAIVSYLHRYLSDKFDLQSKIKWKVPTYYMKSWVCYLNPIKNDGVELAFFRGNLLSNQQGILNSKGRKIVSGIDLFMLESIDFQIIDEILNEALILDNIHSK